MTLQGAFCDNYIEAEVMLLLDLSLCRVCICVISYIHLVAKLMQGTDIVSATWRLTRLTIHLSQNMTWWEI